MLAKEYAIEGPYGATRCLKECLSFVLFFHSYIYRSSWLKCTGPVGTDLYLELGSKDHVLMGMDYSLVQSLHYRVVF